MDTRAQHHTLDVWLRADITPALLESIAKIVRQDQTALHEYTHSFKPIGEMTVFIFPESHFVVRTYPEHRYLSMDLYVCNMNADVKTISQRILSVLPVEEVERQTFMRGQKKTRRLTA